MPGQRRWLIHLVGERSHIPYDDRQKYGSVASCYGEQLQNSTHVSSSPTRRGHWATRAAALRLYWRPTANPYCKQKGCVQAPPTRWKMVKKAVVGPDWKKQVWSPYCLKSELHREYMKKLMCWTVPATSWRHPGWLSAGCLLSQTLSPPPYRESDCH